MNFKVCVKNTIILWQPRYYNLFTEKEEKTHIFEAPIFSKTYCYCQSQEIIFKHHL